jgi:TM2 domain-containing membrane protein YozV
VSVFKPSHRPPVAALLSFLIPGLGQLYNREVLRGLFWLLVTPALWLASAGVLGWLVHVLSAVTAYHRAELLLRQHSWPIPVRA